MSGVLSEGEATLSVGPEEHIVTVDVPIRLVLCRDAVRYGDREALRSAVREHIEDAVVRALDKFSEAIGVSKSE